MKPTKFARCGASARLGGAGAGVTAPAEGWARVEKTKCPTQAAITAMASKTALIIRGAANILRVNSAWPRYILRIALRNGIRTVRKGSTPRSRASSCFLFHRTHTRRQSMTRFALITGAAGSIGTTISELFAERGLRLLLADKRDTVSGLAQKLRARGAEAESHIVDLTDESSVLELTERAKSLWGGCDILINNAGIGGRNITERTPSAEWENVLKVNMTAPFLLCRELLPVMREKGWGRVVNVASRLGRTYIFNANLAYSASKAGLIGMTRQLGGEFASNGVTVNAVAPGSIDTGYVQTLLPDDAARLLQTIPAGRSGKITEVAAAIYFLASDEAAYITGACLDVNGGGWMG